MNINCLIFVRLLIPQHRVNYCHFWMPIQAIIKLASPLTINKNSVHHTIQNLLLHKDGVRPQEWGSYILEGHSHCLGNSNRAKHRGVH
jgi:hypothetical protein